MTAFIWDLDGTLLDSYDVFVEALEETFTMFDLAFDKEGARAFIQSRSVDEFLRKQAVKFDNIKSVFSSNAIRRNDKIQLMDGALEVLEWTKVRHIPNFIVTHKGANAYRLLEQLHISDYFVEVVTSANGFPRKPDPAALNYLTDKYKLLKSDTCYIGDRQIDIEVAQRAGIQSINFLSSENSVKINQLTDIIE